MAFPASVLLQLSRQPQNEAQHWILGIVANGLLFGPVWLHYKRHLLEDIRVLYLFVYARKSAARVLNRSWKYNFDHIFRIAVTQWWVRWRLKLPASLLFTQPFVQAHINKKKSKFHVTGLYAGNSPVTGEFPAQKASDAENASIWWRHHGLRVGGIQPSVRMVPIYYW